MKTLYFDCAMGAAGDMLTAALLELLPDKGAFVAKLNALGLPGVTVAAEHAVKCGIGGTHVSVKVDGVEEGEEHHHHDHHHEHEHEHEHHHDHDHEHHHDHDHEHHHDHDHEHHHDHDHEHHHEHHHHHSSLHDVEHIVGHLDVSQKVKEDVLAVYRLIAEAESAAHGVPVTDIHFHEVGTMDAIADVTAVCLLMEELAPQRVAASPVHVGSGHVHCAHGVLPVPAPATAHILRGVPIYGGAIQGELCTPTGAALLKHFATSFGPMPPMAAEAVGYGMGKKDFPAANCVRAFLGESVDEEGDAVELKCNLDDMTAEAIGFAMETLLSAGALDVFTTPIGMKKCRPGTLLTVLCRPEDREQMAALLLRHTTTLGVRETVCRRYTLTRSEETVDTPFGAMHRKVAEGHGVRRAKFEYGDVAGAAKEHGLSLAEVLEKLEG